jgi:tetratricopeptide (TPR) repeat protein
MTDVINSKLNQIKQLIDKRELNEALVLVEEIKKDKQMESKLKVRCLLLKSEILRDKREYKNAEKFAKEAFELSKELKNPLLQFNCLVLMKNTISWQQNEKKDINFSNFACFELERIREEFPKEIENIKRRYLRFYAITHVPIDREKALEYFFDCLSLAEVEGNQKSIASIYGDISTMHMDLGKYSDALKYALDSYKIYEKLNEETSTGDFNEIRSIHNKLSMIYLRLGNLDKNLEHGSKSLNYSKKIGDKFSAAYAYFLIGWGYNGKGMLQKALECGFEAYNIFSEMGESFGAAWGALIIADSYRKKGELNKALRYYSEAEEIYREYGNEFSLARTKQGIGIVYREKGMLEQAENNFKESLDSFIANIDYSPQRPGRDIARSLYYLILISLERNNNSQSIAYLKQLEEFTKQEVGNKLVEHRYSVSKGVFLSRSKDKKNIIKAERLFNQVIDEDIAEIEITVMAIYAQCEINIRKIQETKSGTEILQQSKKLLQRLVNIAERENSFIILAEAYLLQSQIALLEVEIETAEKLLIKALQIAEEKEINVLAIKISNVYDMLLGHLDKWEEFTSYLPSITERLEMTSIEEMLDQLLRFQSLLSNVKIQKEKPALFFIIDNKETTIFAEKFDKYMHQDTMKHLIHIAKENFEKVKIVENYIPRSRFHEHILIMTNIENFLVGYSFVGKSYNSMKKLREFISKIKQSSVFLIFQERSLSSQPLQLEERMGISKMVDEIFLS